MDKILNPNLQMKNVQDRVNTEKQWVMKYEAELVKTGRKLFGNWYQAAAAQPPTTASAGKPAAVVVSPVKALGQKMPTAARQVASLSF